MIHGLAWRQARNGRQNAKCISRQHDNAFRMTGCAGGRGIGNKAQWISAARVFSQRIIIEIKLACDRVHHHIFQHCAETLRGGKNFRLGFLAQINHFGVAAAFKIKHAIF